MDPDGGPRLRQWQALTAATEAKNRIDDTILEGYAGGSMKAGAVREGRAGVTGRRIATAIGTNVVRHVYAGMHVIADTDTQGNVLRSYTWGPGIDNLLALTVYGPGGTNTYQAISDHLGTVHALVDDSGDTVESYKYDAWGNMLGVYDGSGQSLPSSGIGNRYLFQGREYSWATHAAWGGAGLYFFRARYYDPSTGRWLSNDPIGISGGLNQYAFCANNPVMFVDPEGEEIGTANHPVIRGFHHQKVIITPNDQQRFENHPDFQKRDAQGRRYATIGAGSVNGTLVASVNRPRDVTEPNYNYKVMQLPAQYAGDENWAIGEMLAMVKLYNWYHQVTYWFPWPNSNSFATGILLAAGFAVCSDSGANTPGYSHPLPPSQFAVPERGGW